MVAPTILCISKIPIVTWVGSCEVLMNFTTITKVSKPTRNIQKLNEHVQVTQDVRVGMAHLSLTSCNISFGNEMEIAHAHIVANPNTSSMDFQ
jgi:hypothetical protein